LWTDSKKQNVTIIFEDEGFVYDPVPPDPKTVFWGRFEEVIEVVPHSEISG
jgi:hypothetical protein